MKKCLLLLALVTNFNICCASSEAPAPFDAEAMMAEINRLDPAEMLAMVKALQDAQLPAILASLTTQPAEFSGSKVTLKTPTMDDMDALESMFSDKVKEAYPIGPMKFRYYLINELQMGRHLRGTIQAMRDPEQAALFASMGNSQAIKKMLSGVCHEAKSLLYMIFDNEHNVLIGYVTIRDCDIGNDGQLGIWINERYQGHGRGIEAIQLISKVYFDLYQNEISFTGCTTLSNHKSYHAMLNAGGIDGGYAYKPNGSTERRVIFPNPTTPYWEELAASSCLF